MLQNDPDRLNGLDIAIGHFTGIDEDGEGVSLVVIGIAAPGGRFFVAESSVPQSELQAATPALSAMPATLWFAGQAAINPAPHTAPEYETKPPAAEPRERRRTRQSRHHQPHALGRDPGPRVGNCGGCFSNSRGLEL